MECTDSKLGIPFILHSTAIPSIVLLPNYQSIQGQILTVTGVELPTAYERIYAWSGYVGFGRGGDPNHLHIYAAQEEFNNLPEDR